MFAFGDSSRFAHSDVGQGAGTVSDAAVAAGIEPEDMDARGIFGVVLSVAALVVVIVIAVFQIVNLEVQDIRLETAAAAAEAGTLRDLKLAAVQKLNRYEPIAGAEGRYRIPIERAIELMAKEAASAGAAGYSTEITLRRE